MASPKKRKPDAHLRIAGDIVSRMVLVKTGERGFELRQAFCFMPPAEVYYTSPENLSEKDLEENSPLMEAISLNGGNPENFAQQARQWLDKQKK
jgi:hypothetical protein